MGHRAKHRRANWPQERIQNSEERSAEDRQRKALAAANKADLKAIDKAFKISGGK